jgi:sulfate transport system permease protein
MKSRILPGFRLSLTYTLIYLGLIVIIPLIALLANITINISAIIEIVSDERLVSALFLSLRTAFISSFINAICGLAITWTLVRYKFPGRQVLDAMIDLPFALPTAVAGIAFTALYAPNGWIGSFFSSIDIKIAFTEVGIILVLIFIGLPFVIRTLQPVLQDLDKSLEEAAYSLGASKFQTFFRIIFPSLLPALLTGFALSFARTLGEYGSVIFIAGNIPNKTEIVPLLIMTKLEQFDYIGASVIGAMMLVISFIMLLIINSLQSWAGKK